MNIRVLSTLAVLAVITSMAAVWAVHREVTDWRTPAHGKKVFPGIEERINDVGKLVVHSAGRQMTIQRRGQGWTLAESDGYPVQGKIVQQTLVGLSGMRWLEPKTKKSDRYAKLHLRDPDEKGAESRRLEVFDRKGERLADIIVGREDLYLQSISDGGTYIRMPNEKQAWLAGGQLIIGGEPKDWLSNKIVDIPRARIARAVVRHPNGDVITVVKTEAATPTFKLANIPAGKKLASELYPSDIGRALETFEIHDARKADRVAFTKERTVDATFESVQGLIIRLRVEAIDGANWARLDVAAKESSDAQVRQAAGAIKARTDGWAFRIPEFEAVHIRKTLARILEDSSGKS